MIDVASQVGSRIDTGNHPVRLGNKLFDGQAHTIRWGGMHHIGMMIQPVHPDRLAHGHPMADIRLGRCRCDDDGFTQGRHGLNQGRQPRLVIAIIIADYNLHKDSRKEEGPEYAWRDGGIRPEIIPLAEFMFVLLGSMGTREKAVPT
ncbi:hypothetical protein DESC_700250 [Desulfosarcina cetonica]|nr:hypothetical protein DESC_700250 [Desulfosarcina cetonica]